MYKIKKLVMRIIKYYYYKIKKLIMRIIKYYYYLIIRIGLKMKKKIKLIKNDNILESLYEKKSFTCYVKSRKFEDKVDLSIIVPVYNSEKFIKKCVESIINNKTKYKYEIILINDGSSDSSENIINSLREQYPQIIKCFSKENGGASSARNIGLNHVKGSYITFLDSDDYIGEKFIERLLDIAYEKNVDAVKCGTKTIDFENNVIISIDNRNTEEIDGLMKDKIVDYPSYVWGGIYKSYLLKNFQFPEGNWYEDMAWRFLIYRKLKGFVYLNEIHHYRNMHKNQITKKISKDTENRCLDHLYLIEALIDDNTKFGLDNDIYLYLNVLHECSTIMVKRMEQLNNELKEQVFLRVYYLVNRLYNSNYDIYLKGKYKIINDIILNKRYDLWLLLKYM